MDRYRLYRTLSLKIGCCNKVVRRSSILDALLTEHAIYVLGSPPIGMVPESFSTRKIC